VSKLSVRKRQDLVSNLANRIVTRDWFRVIRPETIAVAKIGQPLPVMSEVSTREWYRQAKLKCGTCKWEGWSEPWRISGPGEVGPLVHEFEVKEDTCPSEKCKREREFEKRRKEFE